MSNARPASLAGGDQLGALVGGEDPEATPGVESWSSARFSATVNTLARLYQI